MTPIENLYYAIGQMAYAVARADGAVQKEERQRFLDIINGELNGGHIHFDISSIIFHVMDKDKASTGDAYFWAMKQITQNSHYLSPALKTAFISVMERVAQAYPPVMIEEQLLIDKFKKDIAPLQGDPLYYSDAS